MERRETRGGAARNMVAEVVGSASGNRMGRCDLCELWGEMFGVIHHSTFLIRHSTFSAMGLTLPLRSHYRMSNAEGTVPSPPLLFPVHHSTFPIRYPTIPHPESESQMTNLKI